MGSIISRRGLFGLFGGVVAAPLVKVPAALPAPLPVSSEQWIYRGFANYANYEPLAVSVGDVVCALSDAEFEALEHGVIGVSKGRSAWAA